jgi:hypothetical protein
MRYAAVAWGPRLLLSRRSLGTHGSDCRVRRRFRLRDHGMLLVPELVRAGKNIVIHSYSFGAVEALDPAAPSVFAAAVVRRGMTGEDLFLSLVHCGIQPRRGADGRITSAPGAITECGRCDNNYPDIRATVGRCPWPATVGPSPTEADSGADATRVSARASSLITTAL